MESFHNRFPDIAGEETRFVDVLDHPVIPSGQYGFFESYCNEKGCDCRRVLINIISRDNLNKIWATINYQFFLLKRSYLRIILVTHVQYYRLNNLICVLIREDNTF